MRQPRFTESQIVGIIKEARRGSRSRTWCASHRAQSPTVSGLLDGEAFQRSTMKCLVGQKDMDSEARRPTDGRASLSCGRAAEGE